ncbi:putative transport and golgi organization 2 [Operophtera brumata]|uniref:Putative transport and golgi organization 2 n=1 Tax=Operophtera brumata TaxID=104452 RepID=A0A0L7L366_OPEBR|nr:putative transport and golgi organization 2 [Operophtera brumata]
MNLITRRRAPFDEVVVKEETTAEEQVVVEEETTAEEQVVVEEETTAEEQVVVEEETTAEEQVVVEEETTAEEQVVVKVERTSKKQEMIENEESAVVDDFEITYNGSQDEGSDYSLIVASNRDEYYKRPSKNMWYWEEDHNVIGGRDLQAECDGGTWLAMSPSRRKLGVLLNLPRTLKPNAKSKHPEPSIYTYSNTSNELTPHKEIYLGFGNSLPDIPLKKVEAGKEQMHEICRRLNNIEDKAALVENLIQLLKDDERHLPDPELAKRRPAVQNQLSSIFVSIPEGGYGTRTHTIILITKTGQVDVIEISLQPPMDVKNPHWKKTEFQFDL